MTTFHGTVSKFAQSFGRRINQAHRKVTLELGRMIVQRTPVDTGRLRANWIHKTGSAPNYSLPLKDKSGNATIAKLASGLESSGAGRVDYLVNNLTYGPRIEYEGYSKKAPNGMVRVSVAEAKSKMIAVIQSVFRQ